MLQEKFYGHSHAILQPDLFSRQSGFCLLRITNADTQCGQITNPPERNVFEYFMKSFHKLYIAFFFSFSVSFPF